MAGGALARAEGGAYQRYKEVGCWSTWSSPNAQVSTPETVDGQALPEPSGPAQSATAHAAARPAAQAIAAGGGT